MSELLGIDAVVLVLAAVNGSNVKSVSQDKSEMGGVAGVGQPIPAEHAFGADSQIVAVGATNLRKNSKSLFLTLVWTSFLPWRSMTQTYIW